MTLDESEITLYLSPGDALKVLMRENQLDVATIAAFASLTPGHVREIARGDAIITPAVAAGLQRATGLPVSAWLTLQHNLDSRP